MQTDLGTKHRAQQPRHGLRLMNGVTSTICTRCARCPGLPRGACRCTAVCSVSQARSNFLAGSSSAPRVPASAGRPAHRAQQSRSGSTGQALSQVTHVTCPKCNTPRTGAPQTQINGAAANATPHTAPRSKHMPRCTWRCCVATLCGAPRLPARPVGTGSAAAMRQPQGCAFPPTGTLYQNQQVSSSS